MPEKFVIPLFFELERERSRTHRWMKIKKHENVEDVGLMEEKLNKMRKELNNLRVMESIMKE